MAGVASAQMTLAAGVNNFFVNTHGPVHGPLINFYNSDTAEHWFQVYIALQGAEHAASQAITPKIPVPPSSSLPQFPITGTIARRDVIRIVTDAGSVLNAWMSAPVG